MDTKPRVPVQVRLTERMHADVAAQAERLGISRNAAYTLLIATGLEFIHMGGPDNEQWLRQRLEQRAQDGASWVHASA